MPEEAKEQTQAAPDQAPSPSDPVAATDAQKLALMAGISTEAQPKEDKPPTQAAPAPEGGRDETEAGETTPEGGEPVDPDKLALARNALKRDNYPDDILDGLPPERVVALGDKAKKRQDDQRKKLNEYENWKQFQAHANQESEQGSPQDAATPGPALSETLDEESSDAINRLVSDATQRATESVVGMYQQELQQVKDQHHNTMFNMACDDLARSGTAPHLKDSASRSLVFEKAVKLSANADDYTDENGNIDYRQLATDAAALAMPNRALTENNRLTQHRYQSEINGQPSPPSDTQTPVAAMSEKDKHIHALQLLKDGKTPAEVRSLIASR